MSNVSQDAVFQLIKTLARSEKRHFRLFATRQGSSSDIKFLQLFDALDGMSHYDEEQVLKQVPGIKKAQLANQKANLYKQMLASLRLYHANQNLDIQLHEQLDHARVLYNKGLYQQSLKMLEKVKVAAQQASYQHTALTALTFEKQIEQQYITRSLEGRAEALTEEANDLLGHLSRIHHNSSLALRLYGLYIKLGHARTQEERDKLTEFFKANVPTLDPKKACFSEKLSFYQSHVWYNYILQDFKSCYRYAQKWVDLFEEEPPMKQQQTTDYIKGLHNLLLALYNMLYYSKFKEALKKLEDFAADADRRSNPNIEMLLFLYIYTNRINAFYMEGQFTEGLKIVPEIKRNLNVFKQQLDPHRQLIFFYKIACLYFGSGDYNGTIIYLEKIIHYKDVNLREDIQCFARILNLIAHYEAGKDELLDYQVKSVYRFLGRMNDQQPMQVAICKFLRNLPDINPLELKSAFIDLKETLLKIADNPLYRRPFLYLDIISWLDSKIKNVPVQQVMQQKFRNMK
ncbi:hypothetical protein POKO110462_06810 [Pontibacter korlensis]|uniref:Uncharacterized protein n=1 Tax=Pontibacter korlensis TaxID=400092 RepID=A0A0E3ZFQ1_9BACT|nr:hypothetical protein [Pontibacter korlensis]AKD04484.1 hypothetical protein PKOR_17045 [Pontibacter korlensis]